MRRSLFPPPASMVLAAVLIGGLLGLGCSSEGGTSSSTPRAPDFQLQTHRGNTFDLSDHRGQVVVVNFWATWCAPCLEEIPTFVEMQQKYGDQGLQFVGVSLDQNGFEAVKPFADKMEINYPLVVDDGSLAKRFGGLQGVPTTYVVGTEGYVHHRIEGITTERRLMAMVEGLLEDASSPANAPSETASSEKGDTGDGDSGGNEATETDDGTEEEPARPVDPSDPVLSPQASHSSAVSS